MIKKYIMYVLSLIALVNVSCDLLEKTVKTEEKEDKKTLVMEENILAGDEYIFNHNLNISQLDVTVEYYDSTDDEWHDYTEYNKTEKQFNFIKDETLAMNLQQLDPDAVCYKDDSIAVVYEDGSGGNDTYKGKIWMLEEDGSTSVKIFNDHTNFSPRTEDPVAATLSNGHIVIAYRENVSSNYSCYFTVYNPDTETFSSEYSFFNGNGRYFSITPLTQNRFAVCWTDYSVSTLKIFNEDGSLAASTDYLNTGAYCNSVKELSNGNIAVAFRDYGNNNNVSVVVFNSSGTIIIPKKAVSADVVSSSYDSVNLIPSSNGEFIVSYTGDNGVYYLFDSSGNLKINGGPHVFNTGDTRWLSSVNVDGEYSVRSYLDDPDNDVNLDIINPDGSIMETSYVGPESNSFSITRLFNITNNRFIILYGGYYLYYRVGEISDVIYSINTEVVSVNEFKVINDTAEDLNVRIMIKY